jgi:uncharacterized membrane protein
VIFFSLVILVSVVIALRFWLLGAWIVMPLMLMELSVLGTAFYLVQKASRNVETIDLSDNLLRVTRKFRSVVDEWQFQPYWVQVILRADHISWYPTHLCLRSHGKVVEIGTCLTDEEREELSESLKQELQILKPAERI